MPTLVTQFFLKAFMGPYSDDMKNAAAAQGYAIRGGQSSQGVIRSGLGTAPIQAARDAPVYDQMRARIGAKIESLQQAVNGLQTALAPVLDSTGKNTPQPPGYANKLTEDVPPPHHDSGLIAFMNTLEVQIIAARDQVEWMTRALPFDQNPF